MLKKIGSYMFGWLIVKKIRLKEEKIKLKEVNII